MAKFQVGEKVLVRTDLIIDEKYAMENGEPRIFFVTSMKSLAGKVVTISKVSSNTGGFYHIEEDREQWNWTDGMFEGLAVPITPQKEPKAPQEVVLVQDVANVEMFVDRLIFNDPATIMFYRLPLYKKVDGKPQFDSWGDERKIVSRVNVDEGDVFDKQTGFDVCLLKAIRKEADKALAKV